MRVIPSIDLMNGKCVRLVRGEKESAIAYEKGPLSAAKEYEEDGAKLIHIVDLDGAFTGNMKNIGIIRQLASCFAIQVGGGIRSEQKIREVLDAGAKKAVVSTILLGDQEAASKLKEKYYGKLVGSFDFKNSRLKYAGWTRESPVAFETAAEGLAEIIVTDIERDGALGGPNLGLLNSLRQRCKAKIVAAGGVRDAADLFELKRIGMDGVIVGKAFLENRIRLRDALKFESRDVDYRVD